MNLIKLMSQAVLVRLKGQEVVRVMLIVKLLTTGLDHY
jgi:hypothetical protein